MQYSVPVPPVAPSSGRPRPRGKNNSQQTVDSDAVSASGSAGDKAESTPTSPATANNDPVPSVEIMPHEVTLDKLVGTGSTADVYAGKYKGMKVAVKQIHDGRARRLLKEQVAFNREVAVLARVRHDNLVHFYGVGFTKPFQIITGMCEGGDCYQLLHSALHIELSWTQRHKICSDVADAMQYLHSLTPPVIHRDLKSLNLLLEKTVESSLTIPHVKVSDFGLARIVDESVTSHMTKHAGTQNWMAPEVLTGTYDHKADVYSYAMVMFEVLAREIPFEDLDPSEAASEAAKGFRPDLDAILAECPQGYIDLMKECWAEVPASRPEFDVIRDELKAID